MTDVRAADTPIKPTAKIRTHYVQQSRANGERFAMLTAYGHQHTAEIFDRAGIDAFR